MFVVSRVFKFLGVGRSLFIHPLVALCRLRADAPVPSVRLMGMLKVADNSLDYSLGNTTKQALWLPTSREAKYKAKQAVDSFFVRVGDVLQAGIVFIGERLLLAVPAFAAINVVLVGGWLGVVAMLNSTSTQKAASRSGASQDRVDRADRGVTEVELTYKEAARRIRVEPGTRVNLKRHDPGWAGGSEFKALRQDELKARAVESLDKNIADMAKAQELLYATDCYSVLIVFQAMDAAGKDGTIKHVMSGRQSAGLPGLQLQEAVRRGTRSQLPLALHEGPARARPHRHLQPLVLRGRPRRPRPPRVSREPEAARGEARSQVLGRALRRHQRVRAPPDAERHAHPEVLPPSLEEGAEEALRGPSRRPGQALEVFDADMKERAFWDDYQAAFTDVLQQTSTPWAPWWVIPADHKFVTRALVSGITTHAIRRLNLKWPVVSAEQKRLLARARRELASGK